MACNIICFLQNVLEVLTFRVLHLLIFHQQISADFWTIKVGNFRGATTGKVLQDYNIWLNSPLPPETEQNLSVLDKLKGDALGQWFSHLFDQAQLLCVCSHLCALPTSTCTATQL